MMVVEKRGEERRFDGRGRETIYVAHIEGMELEKNPNKCFRTRLGLGSKGNIMWCSKSKTHV